MWGLFWYCYFHLKEDGHYKITKQICQSCNGIGFRTCLEWHKTLLAKCQGVILHDQTTTKEDPRTEITNQQTRTRSKRKPTSTEQRCTRVV